MKVIEPGHVYELDTLDGATRTPMRLTFVNREGTPHSGTQTQEVLRVIIDMLDALIDRTNHCDACLRWEGNDQIVKHMSEAQRRARLGPAAARAALLGGFHPPMVSRLRRTGPSAGPGQGEARLPRRSATRNLTAFRSRAHS